MKILIERYLSTDKQTIGNLYLLEDNSSLIESFYSLELPYRDNKRRISCIPEGNYIGFKHNSPKFGNTVWIKDVPKRSEILIHAGNFGVQTKFIKKIKK